MKKKKQQTAVLIALAILSFSTIAVYYEICVKPRIAVCRIASPDNQNSIAIFSYCPPYKYYANEQITIICKTHDGEVLKINTEVANNEVRITPDSGNVAVTWYENIAYIVLNGSQQIPQIITVNFMDLTYTSIYGGGRGAMSFS